MSTKMFDNLKENTIIADQILEYDPYRGSECPIIIDNGAYHCRVGYSSDDRPKMIFRNLIAKLRGKKDPEILVGNDITNLEAVKWLLRSPFDNNVVTQFDIMEIIFDHIFSHLGIDKESIDHPIVMNEPLCVPLWSRSNIEELLFECYQIPSLMFGADSLFSLYHNIPNADNYLIISFGHHTSHILPVIDGHPHPELASRINLGGFNLTLYLQRLLHLKYPKHTQEFTFSKCEYIVQNICRFSSDYDSEVLKWADDKYYYENVKHFKTSKTCFSNSIQIESSLNDNFAQNCHRLLAKITSSLTKKREKQLFDYEERRKKLKTLQELVDDEELADPALVTRAYHNAGIKNSSELRVKLNEINHEIKNLKNQLDPKKEHQTTVIDELRELQRSTNCDESSWISYVRDIRCSRIGENAWILNELLREYEHEAKRMKRHGIAENVIDLGSEMIRVPELLFSPNALIKYQQCGISEAIEEVIKKLERPELSANIFITGGCASIKGIKQRIETDVTAIRPFQSPLNVTLAENPLLDSWRGARESAVKFTDKFITKCEYNEFGSSYIKEFRCSNKSVYGMV